MQLPPPVKGIIHKRYKRFLCDIELENGEVITAHTANTGSMKSCWEPGWKVSLSKSSNPKRKLAYSLELTHNGLTWIGVNTARPNSLAQEAIEKEIIPELKGYTSLKREVDVGESRIDILLEKNGDKCFVEVKNVTLKDSDGLARFPDSVSERGQKHLCELINLKEQGIRAVMLFIIQREDVDKFAPAYEIDPEYALLLKEAQEIGVEILPYQCKMNENEIIVNKRIPLVFE